MQARKEFSQMTPDEKKKHLHQLIKSHETDALRAILSEDSFDNTILNLSDEQGKTAFLLAIETNKPGIVLLIQNFLERHKININIVDHNNDCALTTALKCGNEIVLEFLLKIKNPDLYTFSPNNQNLQAALMSFQRICEYNTRECDYLIIISQIIEYIKSLPLKNKQCEDALIILEKEKCNLFDSPQKKLNFSTSACLFNNAEKKPQRPDWRRGNMTIDVLQSAAQQAQLEATQQAETKVIQKSTGINCSLI